MTPPNEPAPPDGARELLWFTALTVVAYLAGALIIAAVIGGTRLP